MDNSKISTMKNALLLLPLLSIEWEEGKGTCITVGWLKSTYSIAFLYHELEKIEIDLTKKRWALLLYLFLIALCFVGYKLINK